MNRKMFDFCAAQQQRHASNVRCWLSFKQLAQFSASLVSVTDAQRLTLSPCLIGAFKIELKVCAVESLNYASQPFRLRIKTNRNFMLKLFRFFMFLFFANAFHSFGQQSRPLTESVNSFRSFSLSDFRVGCLFKQKLFMNCNEFLN